MEHNLLNFGLPTVAKLSLEEYLERAVRSRPSGERNPRTEFSTPEELEYMRVAVRESTGSSSLRQFIALLCKVLAVELVDIEFRLSVNAHMGFSPGVRITTRKEVSASVRQDMEGLIGRIVKMLGLGACGYRILVVSATKAEKSG